MLTILNGFMPTKNANCIAIRKTCFMIYTASGLFYAALKRLNSLAIAWLGLKC